jgi:methionyl-tRNA formyltransferase
VGSTVHRIDPGIDTGEVVAQAAFDITPADSFVTYPYLHVAAVLGPIEEVVRRARAGEDLGAETLRTDLPSKLRTHPTLAEYLRHARAGVR